MSHPPKRVSIQLLVRMGVFGVITYIAHLSGVNWGAFLLGGWWAVFALAFPGKLHYDE